MAKLLKSILLLFLLETVVVYCKDDSKPAEEAKPAEKGSDSEAGSVGDASLLDGEEGVPRLVDPQPPLAHRGG